MTTTIKPIETVAYGRRFRSRLEARYAVFLTTLGLRWEYEPEGFQLPSGWYLPDFYLPDIRGGTWLEIKPHGQGSFGWGKGPRWTDRRLYEFTESVGQFFVANGLPDPVAVSDCASDYQLPGLMENDMDPHWWCVCGCSRTAGIQFDGRGDRVICPHSDCRTSPHGDKGYSHNHPRIIAAAVAAHSARFEHGETYL